MIRALITGGSSGIGRAIAEKLAQEGNHIYITGRDESKLNQVKNNIEVKGAICHVHAGNVGDTALAEQTVADALNKMGEINVLVANAGVGRFKLLEEMTDEDFDLQFKTNVRGVFVYIRPVLKHMKQMNRGQIIVTSSNLGLHTAARCSVYAATKHAVQAMIGSLRKELSGTNVKAATVNPGSVDTPWFDGKDVNRDKMLDVNDVAEAALLIIKQGERSDIDHILLIPARR